MPVHKLVLRFANGKVVKGQTYNFGGPTFRLFPPDSTATEDAVDVELADLKAAFFVRDFRGRPGYKERDDFRPDDKIIGRKVEVVFSDGEKLRGTTSTYTSTGPGFYVNPVDPNSNNLRVYVVNRNTKSVHLL